MKIKEVYSDDKPKEVKRLAIVGDDNRNLFELSLTENGGLEIYAGALVKLNGVMLDIQLKVTGTGGTNIFIVSREPARES